MGTETEERDIIVDFRTALREFSQPEDLDPEDNKPTLLMEKGGVRAVCFRRGNFVPSGKSVIANLLRDYENGDEEALLKVRRLVEQIEEKIEIKRNGEGVGERRIITHIVLLCKKNVFEVLGLQ